MCHGSTELLLWPFGLSGGLPGQVLKMNVMNKMYYPWSNKQTSDFIYIISEDIQNLFKESLLWWEKGSYADHIITHHITDRMITDASMATIRKSVYHLNNI